MAKYYDINGKEIKVGMTVRYVKNTTDLKQYDNFTARVKLFDGKIGTESPFKDQGVKRTFEGINNLKVEIIK